MAITVFVRIFLRRHVKISHFITYVPHDHQVIHSSSWVPVYKGKTPCRWQTRFLFESFCDDMLKYHHLSLTFHTTIMSSTVQYGFTLCLHSYMLRLKHVFAKTINHFDPKTVIEDHDVYDDRD